jgi:hypothetical protein
MVLLVVFVACEPIAEEIPGAAQGENNPEDQPDAEGQVGAQGIGECVNGSEEFGRCVDEGRCFLWCGGASGKLRVGDVCEGWTYYPIPENDPACRIEQDFDSVDGVAWAAPWTPCDQWERVVKIPNGHCGQISCQNGQMVIGPCEEREHPWDSGYCFGECYTMNLHVHSVERCRFGCNCPPNSSSCEPDAIPACPHDDGRYCGDPTLNQDPESLYNCVGGNYDWLERCEHGCQDNGDFNHDACFDPGANQNPGDGNQNPDDPNPGDRNEQPVEPQRPPDRCRVVVERQVPDESEITLRQGFDPHPMRLTYHLSGRFADAEHVDFMTTDEHGIKIHSPFYVRNDWPWRDRVRRVNIPQNCGLDCNVEFGFPARSPNPGMYSLRIRPRVNGEIVDDCEASWFVTSPSRRIIKAGADYHRGRSGTNNGNPNHLETTGSDHVRIKSHGIVSYDINIPEHNIQMPGNRPLRYTFEVSVRNMGGNFPGMIIALEVRLDGNNWREHLPLSGEIQDFRRINRSLSPGRHRIDVRWLAHPDGPSHIIDGRDINLYVREIRLLEEG